MWANSTSNNIEQDPQPSDGWELMDSGYEPPTMFVGEQVPYSLDIVNRSPAEIDCEMTDDDTDSETDTESESDDD